MKKRLLKMIVGVVVLGLLLVGVALGVTVWHVERSVREYCAVAQEAHPHPGDDVAALTDFMNSDAHPHRERNLAIWALGRLRDPRALSALEAVYTPASCVICWLFSPCTPWRVPARGKRLARVPGLLYSAPS